MLSWAQMFTDVFFGTEYERPYGASFAQITSLGPHGTCFGPGDRVRGTLWRFMQ